MSPLLHASENDLFLPPRLALDLLEGAPLADVFALMIAANDGAFDALLEEQS